uniref:PNPLA domain-containing protein n=1 Tax=Pelusios castaneus TaxID=367368 RepID=A0A8C8RHC1_9SAUR
MVGFHTGEHVKGAHRLGVCTVKLQGEAGAGTAHGRVVKGLKVWWCCKDLKQSFHEAAKDARKTILGPLSPGCNMLRTVQKGLYRMLPENSHQVASGRLHISLTRVIDGQNVMVSEFTSKEDLIQALICSCFVPIYCGFIPPSFRGVRYVDGGFTNLQPCTDLEAVITVSPFTGELDICPRDLLPADGILSDVRCIPPQVLHEFYFQGYQDAVLFLHRNGKCYLEPENKK